MALHVDLVRNDWSGGYQERVAQLRLKDGRLDVNTADPKWAEVALRPLPGLDPNEEPKRFLEELHRHLRGTHLTATQPHHDKDCPFKNGDRLPAKRSRVRRRQRTLA